MEDATIQSTTNESNESNLYQQGQFPSVITTDDLVFELGKNTVDKLNKEKLLTSLLNKTKIVENKVIQLGEENISALTKMESFSSSNKLYEENNRKLGDELSKVRKILVDKEKENNQLNAVVMDKENQIKVLVTEKNQLVEVNNSKISALVTEKNQLVEKHNTEVTALIAQHNKIMLELREAHKSDIVELEKEITVLNQAKNDLIAKNKPLPAKKNKSIKGK